MFFIHVYIIACVIFEHGAILSRDTVESIANETIQSYIKGSPFIDTVRQAVKDDVQEKMNEFINPI